MHLLFEDLLIQPYSNLACGITEIFNCLDVDELRRNIQNIKDRIYEDWDEGEDPEHGNLLLYVVNQEQEELEDELIRQGFKVLIEWTNIKTDNLLRLYGYEYWPG